MAREHRQLIGFWRPPPPDSPDYEARLAELVAEITSKARDMGGAEDAGAADTDDEDACPPAG